MFTGKCFDIFPERRNYDLALVLSIQIFQKIPAVIIHRQRFRKSRFSCVVERCYFVNVGIKIKNTNFLIVVKSMQFLPLLYRKYFRMAYLPYI